MIHRSFAFASLALVALAAGCGGAPSADTSGDPKTPLEVLDGNQGHVEVEVRTGPTQPPPRGLVTVDLAIHDATGKPLDGLTVSVVPFMPAMGHGTSVVPTVTPRGDGEYEVSNVGCFMPGRWELRTTVEGPVEDYFVVSFEVP